MTMVVWLRVFFVGGGGGDHATRDGFPQLSWLRVLFWFEPTGRK